MAKIIPFGGHTPEIDPTAFIADSAVIIGYVTIKAGANIWPNVVIRGDEAHITIGENVSLQDNSTVHTDPDSPMVIGDNALIGHNAILHGKSIGKGCLVGMGAILLDGSEIGDESIIGAGTMITQHKVVPPRSMVYGNPFRVVRKLKQEEIDGVQEGIRGYCRLAAEYKKIQEG